MGKSFQSHALHSLKVSQSKRAAHSCVVAPATVKTFNRGVTVQFLFTITQFFVVSPRFSYNIIVVTYCFRRNTYHLLIIVYPVSE